MSQEKKKEVATESQDSGLVTPEKDRLANEHSTPQGDPSVRRIKPDRGKIPEPLEGGPAIEQLRKRKAG